MKEIKEKIEKAWEDRSMLNDEGIKDAIYKAVDMLDKGEMRVAEPVGEDWVVNDWLKKAVVLYFSVSQMEVIETGPFEYHDKIKLKTGYKEKGIRIVPNAVVRYGAYLARGVVAMPSYVNIGAYVDESTMVDNWTIVGSCAQIGKNIHLSAGVVIGGVLEPVQAAPVIIEDDCFIGAKASVVEGVRVQKGAVLASNVNITQSTRIIDVTKSEPVEYRGIVPPQSVVVPGSFTKEFPAGQYQVDCALIVGKRKESTDKKISLNQVLRDFNVAG